MDLSDSFDAPFSPSMLDGRHEVIIHCPESEAAEELMDVLGENGVKWVTGERPVSYKSYWSEYKYDMCYHISFSKHMSYGRVSGNTGCRSGIKCTFYGSEPDIEISDTDFEAIILAGRGS